MQDGQLVAYASLSVTSAERNYAQIEKELLAVVFDGKIQHGYVRPFYAGQKRPQTSPIDRQKATGGRSKTSTKDALADTVLHIRTWL